MFSDETPNSSAASGLLHQYMQGVAVCLPLIRTMVVRLGFGMFVRFEQLTECLLIT